MAKRPKGWEERQAKEHRERELKRTTWIRFHLPRALEWPAWTVGATPDWGPLEGVDGIKSVWLARKVEDPEQAALIVDGMQGWKSPDDLATFQRSPACAELLGLLPALNDDGVQTPSLSLMMQGLRLGNDTPSSSSTPSSSRFLTFKWADVFNVDERMEGRVTTTALEIQYSAAHTETTVHRPLTEAFDVCIPRTESKDLDNRCWQPQGRMMLHQRAWGRVVADDGEDKEEGRAIWCEFRMWNDSRPDCATKEREEVLAGNATARGYWERAVEKVRPPVVAWEQERWDVVSLPCEASSWTYVPTEEDRIWQEEHDEALKKYLEYHRPRLEAEERERKRLGKTHR